MPDILRIFTGYFPDIPDILRIRRIFRGYLRDIFRTQRIFRGYLRDIFRIFTGYFPDMTDILRISTECFFLEILSSCTQKHISKRWQDTHLWYKRILLGGIIPLRPPPPPSPGYQVYIGYITSTSSSILSLMRCSISDSFPALLYLPDRSVRCRHPNEPAG